MHPHPNPRPGASSGRLPRILIAATLVLALGACERGDWDPTVKIGDPRGHVVDPGRRPTATGATTRPLASPETPVDSTATGSARAQTLQRGSGTFVRKITPPQVDISPGDVTLNFDGTDLREVVKVVLGDLRPAPGGPGRGLAADRTPAAARRPHPDPGDPAADEQRGTRLP